MRGNPLLPLLPVQFWLRVVAPDRILSLSQIEQFNILIVYLC